MKLYFIESSQFPEDPRGYLIVYHKTESFWLLQNLIKTRKVSSLVTSNNYNLKDYFKYNKVPKNWALYWRASLYGHDDIPDWAKELE